ncbi:MAG: protein serine phosphatase with GAF(s) sensor(s) [Frankiales bacterium]|nr:protein serine phosphatase with GAF(s) sensor(s) [Frankiales bacterium]
MHDGARTGREFQLAPEPSSVRLARAAVQEFLTAEGLGDRAYDGALAVSEVVTNAVIHGRVPLVLRLLITADGVRIEVGDGSPVSPAFSMIDPTAVTGRGLMLVSAVADRWGVEPEEHGKTVWFAFDHLHPTAAEAEETDRLLASWADGLEMDPAREQVRVVLTDVDTALLAESEAHAEGLLRELTLVAPESPHFGKAQDIMAAAAPLDALRLDVRHQVAIARHEGRATLDVQLTVRREDAEQVRDFMHALDEADRLSRLGELLLVATSPATSWFRTTFLTRVLDQLRS